MKPSGIIVHVGAPDRYCSIGLVLTPSPGASRIRVLHPTAIGLPGSLDEEGDVPHYSEARRVPNPDGGTRWLLSWHELAECERAT